MYFNIMYTKPTKFVPTTCTYVRCYSSFCSFNILLFMIGSACVILFVYLISASAPMFIKQLIDDTENETHTADFTCQANGVPIPTISWYFNDVPVNVSNTEKYEVLLSSPGVSIIRIYNVQSSDVGTYTCNATNVVASITSSGILTVNGKLVLVFLLCASSTQLAVNEQ